jgi:hypothetical protein
MPKTTGVPTTGIPGTGKRPRQEHDDEDSSNPRKVRKLGQDAKKAGKASQKRRKGKKAQLAQRMTNVRKGKVVEDDFLITEQMDNKAKKWYEEVKGRTQGLKVSESDQHRVLSYAIDVIPELVKKGFNVVKVKTLTALSSHVSEMVGLHRDVVWRILNEAYYNEDLASLEGHVRGKASPKHPGHVSDADKQQIADAMRECTSNVQKSLEPPLVTYDMLADYASKKLGKVVNKKMVSALMGRAGLEYGEVKQMKELVRDPVVSGMAKMIFLLDFNEACAEVEKGDAVIIATDETYVESEIRPTNSIHLAGDPHFKGFKAKALPLKTGIMHGFSPHGFLVSYDNGEPFRVNINDKSKHDSGEYIAQGKTLNFNNETFLDWLRNALIPTAKKEHPGKKIYVLFDNAGFHGNCDEDFFDVRKATRKAIVEKLQALGCTKLKYNTGARTADGKVEVKQADLKLHEWIGKKKKRDVRFIKEASPLNDPDTLMLATVRWLHQNGHLDLLRNKAEKLLAAEGMTALWNAPYMSMWNPIELAWAGAKAYARALFKSDRTFANLVKHLRDGMYLRNDGKTNGPRGYVKDDPSDPNSLCEAARKIFDHTIRLMEEYIEDLVPDVAPPPEGVPPVTNMKRWLEGKMGALAAHPELEEARADFCGTRPAKLWYLAWFGRWYGSTEPAGEEDGDGGDAGML